MKGIVTIRIAPLSVAAVFERGKTEHFSHSEATSIACTQSGGFCFMQERRMTEAVGEFSGWTASRGSILTETGDYRYLEGVLNGTELDEHL